MHPQIGHAMSAIRYLANYADAHDLSDADHILTEILVILFGQAFQYG